jgi:hypothetical protein
MAVTKTACWQCDAMTLGYDVWPGGYECACGVRWAEPQPPDVMLAFLRDRVKLADAFHVRFIDHGRQHVPCP